MPAIPDFTRPDWHSARTDDRLVHSIREGKGSMPAMKDTLAARNVMELVSLVRNFRDGRQVVPEDPETGTDPPSEWVSRATSEPVNVRSDAAQGLFQRFCASCHGSDGKGNGMRAQMPWLPDFTSPLWHQRRSDAELRTSIVEGRGRAMPTFGGKIGDDQVRSLVRYVRLLAPAPLPPIEKSSTDFRQRFQELQNEMNDLRREYRAVLLEKNLLPDIQFAPPFSLRAHGAPALSAGVVLNAQKVRRIQANSVQQCREESLRGIQLRANVPRACSTVPWGAIALRAAHLTTGRARQ
jgi:mono/diheme cytochrome c family protein